MKCRVKRNGKLMPSAGLSTMTPRLTSDPANEFFD